MYDIVVMITNTPSTVLVKDFGRLSFRLSHDNDQVLTWMAVVRLVCLIATGWRIMMYFVMNISRHGCKVTTIVAFNLEQYWILCLLFVCALYDEPFFEYRRNNPSIGLAVFSEIPSSLFFTGLLTYWLMGVTLVRVRGDKLKNKRQATMRDIVGILSVNRLVLLLVLLTFFVIAQTLLHFEYLTTETNRAVFSSFRHFQTSEDAEKDPFTTFLIVINVLFGVVYGILYIAEAIRSFLDF